MNTEPKNWRELKGKAALRWLKARQNEIVKTKTMSRVDDTSQLPIERIYEAWCICSGVYSIRHNGTDKYCCWVIYHGKAFRFSGPHYVGGPANEWLENQIEFIESNP